MTAMTHVAVIRAAVVSILLTGARELCTKGSFILVAVDENGQPVQIQVTSYGPSEE
jgi:acyl-CoA hydrolase